MTDPTQQALESALRWSLARAQGDAVAELALGLESADTAVRRRAVLAIAEVPGPGSTALLRTALEDDEAEVRDRAAVGLGIRGAADAAPALFEMVAEGRSDVEAAEVLGMLADTESVVRGLLVHLRGDDAPTRLRVTQALAEIPGAAALEALTALALDGDRTIAATAAFVLRLRR